MDWKLGGLSQRPWATRVAIAAASLWMAATIGFVVFNRYRNGSDWDSFADIVFLAVLVPLGVGALCVAGATAGKRASSWIAGLVLLVVLSVAGVNAYQWQQAEIGRRNVAAADKRWDAAAGTLMKNAEKKCQSAYGAPRTGGIDPGKFCMMLEEKEVRRKFERDLKRAP